MQEYISYPIFKGLPVICATSTRASNLGTADENPNEKEIVQNRKKFLNNFNIDIKDLVCMKQVHSSNIYKASRADRAKGALDAKSRIYGFDAMITDEPGIALCVFTADCMPVFLYDKKKNTAAIVHAGWRGTQAQITEKSVEELVSNFKADPKDILAALGPCIQKCCYKICPDVAEQFERSVSKIGEEYFLDLAEENTKQLLDAGLLKDNIYDCAMCTSCRNDLFFSYRNEGAKAGRMMNFMMLKKPKLMEPPQSGR